MWINCLDIVRWLICHLQFMLALLEHSPDIYLDEIQEQLQEQHNVTVSLASISRTLHRLGLASYAGAHRSWTEESEAQFLQNVVSSGI